MKNAVIINLSPRSEGTSSMLVRMCKEFLIAEDKNVNTVDLYPHLDKLDKILNLIKEADTIVVSGPCYINHFPADTMLLLEQIMNHPEIVHGQSLYGIIQGGMPYVHTHESGIRTLELFCNDCNIVFKGAFVMGLGAMLNGKPLEKLINGKKVKKSFLVFLDNIAKGIPSPDSLYKKNQIKIPLFVWKYLSKRMNKSIRMEFAEKKIDYLQPSPYWEM